MPATYIPIASTTLSSSTATVTFSSIPQTYTDLVLRFTSRCDIAAVAATANLTFNGTAGTAYSETYIQSTGAAASSVRIANQGYIDVVTGAVGANATASTFSSNEIYIPNYTASANKPLSLFNVTENNATTAYISAEAGLWRNTAAITSISIALTNFVSGSTFHLYGIKKD